MCVEHVLLFSSPTWQGNRSGVSTIVRNITSLSSELAYSEHVKGNITTLSTNYAQPVSGVIQGLLYVPDLSPNDPCEVLASKYVPQNATRQANLPPTNYNLIAVAPWINANCSLSYLTAARLDPLRALMFYLPDGQVSQPPPASDAVWSLNDNDAWKTNFHYPVYAISGHSGARMMQELSHYSGDLSEVPFGANISAIYQPDPADYVRVWTELHVKVESSFPSIWVLVLAIAAFIICVVGGTSMLMHYIQSRRRTVLKRRVMRGEIDLEASGIKRVTVPTDHIQSFPLFTYNYDASSTKPASSSTIEPKRETPSVAVKAAKVLSEKHDINHQPTCFICLEDYETKVTIIRELPCGHIFHPDCIDEFLGEISSLCPVCKKSNLPQGFCPEVTNSMVRRERATRRLRPRAGRDSDARSMRERGSSWGSSVKYHLQSAPCSPTSWKKPALTSESMYPLEKVDDRPAALRDGDSSTARQRMQALATPIDESRSDNGRPQWRVAVTRIFPGFR